SSILFRSTRVRGYHSADRSVGGTVRADDVSGGGGRFSLRVLIAGGAGYVGSHIVREFRRIGHDVVVFDNYSTGHGESVDGVEQVEGDLRDPRSLRSLFENFAFEAVVHVGAPRGERAKESASYYLQVALGGALNLAHAMLEAGVERLVYGSTELVDRPGTLTTREDLIAFAHRSVEQAFDRIAGSQPLRWLALRHHEIGGADLGGDIGEDPRHSDRIVPQILRVALGLSRSFGVPSSSGATWRRDFVHVTDVARGYVLATERLAALGDPLLVGERIDLATGIEHDLEEVLTTARRATAPIEIPTHPIAALAPTRVVGDASRARELLGWEPRFSDLASIVESAWRWHRGHPSGFSVVDRTDDSAAGERFGAAAVRLGFATPGDVQKALDRQAREEREGGGHKLIGLHMLEMGILSTSQLIDILKEYEE
ncbi:MAG: UDP-glucose 4-epimerase, partial [Planctomycetes bacterium]|nr:UDP-glucose 4-epimerase [Planctomycetota bacterium]